MFKKLKMVLAAMAVVCYSSNVMPVMAADSQVFVNDAFEDEEMSHIYSDPTIERLFSTDYIVTVEKVAVRSEASYSAKTVGYVYRDDIVHVISISDGWARFKSNGTNKYIPASCLTKK